MLKHKAEDAKGTETEAAQATHRLAQSGRAPWRRQATVSLRTRGLALQAAEPNASSLLFPDNTANITVKYGQFDRERTKVHHLPVLISDNGRPSLTGTSTLAVTVCKCNERGEFTFCEELAPQVGFSIQALVAIFLSILTIAGQCPGGQRGTVRGLCQRRERPVPQPGPLGFVVRPPWVPKGWG